MATLNLPTMTPENIARKLGTRATGKLAYETYARREVVGMYVGDIHVEHHGNLIAHFFTAEGEQRLYVTNAGRAGATTRDRLNRILTDNATGCGIQVRQGHHRLILGLAGERRYLDGFTSAEFRRQTSHGTWELIRFNGVPVTASFIELNAEAR